MVLVTAGSAASDVIVYPPLSRERCHEREVSTVVAYELLLRRKMKKKKQLETGRCCCSICGKKLKKFARRRRTTTNPNPLSDWQCMILNNNKVDS